MSADGDDPAPSASQTHAPPDAGLRAVSVPSGMIDDVTAKDVTPSPQDSSEPDDPGRARGALASAREAVHALNRNPTAAGAVRAAREMLPGGPKKDLFRPEAESTQRLNALLDRVIGEEPTVTREFGSLFTATWQAFSRAATRTTHLRSR
ncbi:hypothetical protein [Tsukamurella soli]|uniref:hypothetical protein n=1 Tax=Tsukamurella soli TaxID=644556 RepID=UPI00361EB5E4